MTDSAANTTSLSALHLTVNNHPGVMSHVCGLFARRAFNLEGILVAPIGDGSICSMWLMVHDDGRMEQVIHQVRKLHDVLEVNAAAVDSGVFTRLSQCMDPA